MTAHHVSAAGPLASRARLSQQRHDHLRLTGRIWLLALVMLGTVGCEGPRDPVVPGASMAENLNSIFARIMQRPDIDEASRNYEQMGAEIREALSTQAPELASWTTDGDTSDAACGDDYPGLGSDGRTRDLPDYTVSGNLPDDKYEQALVIIGATVQKYGFSSTPQRLHDAPGSHDAVFHSVLDDGTVRFGTDKNTLLGLSLGCHLTAQAKQRGRPSAEPTH